MEYKKETRSGQQNKSIHLFLEQLAEVLNEQGLTIKAIVEQLPQAECMATKENLKELVWKPIQKALTSKNSTTELSKQREIDIIYDVINKHFGESGISVPPFPTSDELNKP